MDKKIDILGVPFAPVTYREVLEQVRGFVERKERVYLTTPNPEFLVHASRDPLFLQVLKESALVLPDGIGILWAATYLAEPAPKNKLLSVLHWLGSLSLILFRPSRYYRILPQRVTGTDMMVQLAERSGKEHWRIFLLGAAPGVAEIAAENLRHRYPDTQIVGTFAGSPVAEEEEAICRRINETAPDLLFVAYGSPAQDLWIHRNLHRLTSVRVAMGVGGAFDFMAGKIRRAPRFMRSFGLEWLWRLAREPRRFKRIWRATLTFPQLVRRAKLF